MKTRAKLAAVVVCLVVAIGAYWVIQRVRLNEADTVAPVSTPVSRASSPVTVSDIPDEVARAPIAPPIEKPADEPDPPGLVISGMVVTSDEKPGAGAIVAAYTADTGAIRAIAGDDGRFRVVGLRPTPHRLSATLEHFNEAVIDEVNAGSSDIRLVLQPLSAVEGRVLRGETGQPLPEFEVTYLKAPPGDDQHWQNILRGETTRWTPIKNEEGRYRIEDVLSNAEFAVGVKADGFEPAYAIVPPIKPAETAQAPDISLLPEAVILGRVVSGSKEQPLSGAEVFFGREARGRTVARSNPDGRFRIGQLPSGPVTLTVSHPDHLPKTVEATLTRGKETEVEIVLGGGGSIQGTVLDGATPLSRQSIIASRLVPPRIRKDALTDDTGAYTIEGLLPGDIEVIAKLQRPGEPDAAPVRLQKQVLIEDGQTTVVDFQLADASCGIEGTISVAGGPPAMALLKGYVAGESGDTFFNTSTFSDGTYSIRNLPSGDAWLEVTVKLEEGPERRKNIPLQIPPGQIVRQDIQIDASAAIFGTVSTLAQNEAGEVMAVMGPYDFNPAQIDIDELERIEVSTSPISAEGAYRLAGLDPGTYTIIVIVFDPETYDATGDLPPIRSVSQTVTLTANQELAVNLVIS